MRALALAMAFAALSAFADSYEERVLAAIEGLKDDVQTVKDFDEGGMRSKLSSLQRSIDKLLEEQGVAAQRAGYYREKMNDLDVADLYDVTAGNMVQMANLKLARARSTYDKYRSWWDAVAAKCDKLRSYPGLLKGNWATPEWVQSNFIVKNFVRKQWTAYVGYTGRKMEYIDYDLDYADRLGYNSPTIEYEEATCGQGCWCREYREYDLSALNDVLARFNALRDKWNEFNNVNTLPD